ncbi:MAG: hypothetical protein AB4372_34415 [Xenococcus sp. (in: cyanobacteria)]
MQSDNGRSDEFYQGYSPTIPPGIRRLLWIVIPIIAVIVVALSIVLPAIHNQYSTGSYTGFREYEGLLMEQPVPHLMIPRPGQTNSDNAYSRYVLAGTRKTSIDPKILEFAGNWVKLRALPVFRDGMTLLAVSAKATPEIIEPPPNQSLTVGQGQTLGQYTLKGEIVDTKCNLGVMKPGQLKVHRDCAIRCISGGVPPSLRVVDASGNIEYFLLVDSQNKAVNSSILDIVADPVAVTGEVIKYGDLFVLKADPDNYDLL